MQEQVKYHDMFEENEEAERENEMWEQYQEQMHSMGMDEEEEPRTGTYNGSDGANRRSSTNRCGEVRTAHDAGGCEGGGRKQRQGRKQTRRGGRQREDREQYTYTRLGRFSARCITETPESRPQGLLMLHCFNSKSKI